MALLDCTDSLVYFSSVLVAVLDQARILSNQQCLDYWNQILEHQDSFHYDQGKNLVIQMKNR